MYAFAGSVNTKAQFVTVTVSECSRRRLAGGIVADVIVADAIVAGGMVAVGWWLCVSEVVWL